MFWWGFLAGVVFCVAVVAFIFMVAKIADQWCP